MVESVSIRNENFYLLFCFCARYVYAKGLDMSLYLGITPGSTKGTIFDVGIKFGL